MGAFEVYLAATAGHFEFLVTGMGKAKAVVYRPVERQDPQPGVTIYGDGVEQHQGIGERGIECGY